MRLCPWPGAPCLLSVLLSLAVLPRFSIQHDKPRERHYYIAAVQIDWNYEGHGAQSSGPSYKKVVFREYEEGFKQAKTHPPWLGLLGPTLRGQEGETIVVTFRNMADRPYSIHPHGIAYAKHSEGAHYFDNTPLKEKEDDVVLTGEEHTYIWEVTADVAPRGHDPDCLTYTYLSHLDLVKDYNSGLIGALLVCKEGTLDESGNQTNFHQEFVSLFGVFDERHSWYQPAGGSTGNQVFHTVNGYTTGSLPDASLCAHTSVSLHLMGMSSEAEVFSVHFNGHVMQQDKHKVSSIGLISGAATTASVRPVNLGRWLLSSQTSKHLEAGMHAFVDVIKCDGFEPANRKLTYRERRKSKTWNYYIAAEELVWNYAPHMPAYIDEDYKVQYLTQGPTRIGGKYKKAVYTQYTDATFTVRAEEKARKVEVGILGPVIRAQINDVIKIVFKNMASRPYSIYPHGLTIEKSQEGVNYPAGGNHTHGVLPGETHTYTWTVVEEDEPLDEDSRCLTRVYHSAVNTPRDIASGLVGPLLICKSESLNVRNVQVKADKEQHAMFAVFDENKSWYLDDNIRSYCDASRVNKADPAFYQSNLMHSINGYVFESGQTLGFCHGEIATWHVSSVGAQDYIQTATFYGHTFKLNDRTEDFLSLYPMTGETIFMTMDNKGIWLLASLYSHETTKGLRVRFQDVVCFYDYQFELEEEEESNYEGSYSIWKPEEIIEDKKVEKAPTDPVVTDETAVVDVYTDNYAYILGLRTLTNQANDTEELDLSNLDYDAVDVPDGDVPVKSAPSSTSQEGQTTNSTIPLNLESNLGNNSLFLDRQDMDSLNLTVNVTLNQNISENTVPMPSGSVTSVDFNVHNTSVAQTVNQTIHNTSVSHGEGNITTSKDPLLVSNAQNVSVLAQVTQRAQNTSALQEEGNVTTSKDPLLVSKAQNASVMEQVTQRAQNTSASQEEGNVTTSKDPLLVSKAQNVSVMEQVTQRAQNTSVSPEEKSVTTQAANLTVTLPEHNSSMLESERINETLPRVNQTIVNSGDVFIYSVVPPSETKEEHIVLLNTSLKPDSGNQTLMQKDLLSSLQDPLEANASLPIASTVDNRTGPSYVTDQTDTPKDLNNQTKSKTFDTFNTTSSDLQVDGAINITIMNSSLETETKKLLGNGTLALDLTNSSLEVSKRENDTGLLSMILNLRNISGDVSKSSSSEDTSGKKNVSKLNQSPSSSSTALSSETTASQNLSLPTGLGPSSSSEELIDEEEVVIYLKDKDTEAIRTTSLHDQAKNWTYESTHQTVPMENPDHMFKYIGKEAPKPTPLPTPSPTPKPKRKVNVRHRPLKGQGLRTRKKMEYKPEVVSSAFSPRGFHPGLTPRGARPVEPVSSAEVQLNTPVVVGVPRYDFSDYELYIPGDQPNHIKAEEELQEDIAQNEYEYVTFKDPYSSVEDMSTSLDETTQYHLKTSASDPKTRTYFISAEEVEWDYAGYGPKREERSLRATRDTKFKKVVFRSYLDSTFTTADIRGEMEEHLGILGPVIKAEVGETLLVVFRNKAHRPFSLHPNGVSYAKQAEGLNYHDESTHWYQYDNEVQPNTTFAYLWKAHEKVGPLPGESYCRTWAYYSGVNPERDIHTGLIGPLLVCRSDTLNRQLVDMREFVLLFMTFDESKSWYYDKHRALMERKNRRMVMSPDYKENLKFHSINGIVFGLKGLRMYTNQLVRWHLINLGSNKDLHSVHFHGQTFIHKHTIGRQQSVLPLLPGGFETVEMWPSKPGLWQLETEVGLNQQMGMQTLFLVLDNDCYQPLGLEAGSVKDDQITASHTRGIRTACVDFLRPVVISQVATQGAKQMFQSQYVVNFTVSYSTDRRRWVLYKGDSKEKMKTFIGNDQANAVKRNTFFPPLVGRYLRIHPLSWYNKPTLRLEAYGCQLDGCSVPLGMESGEIEDKYITASSVASSWYSGSWVPSLARLNMQGTINAWQAKNTENQWLQVVLPKVKKITGIITQGAKSLGTEMYVISYIIQYSDDGIYWKLYTDDEDYIYKTFAGNTDNNSHVKNYIYPPIFSRYIRIIPKTWRSSITMRIELLGCDFE